MRKFGFLLFLSNLCLCVSLHAQIVNGSFSTGTFSGWSVLGMPTIDTSTPPTGATAGAIINSTNTNATLFPPGSGVDYTTIQDDLHLILPSTNDGTESPLNGQAIYQTITLTAPATLTFEYQPTAEDFYYPSADNIGYSLTNVDSITASDADPGVFYSVDAGASGYTLVTSDVIAPGTYILGFISYNTGPPSGLTSFEVSDIEVPEPTAWMLMSGGLVLLAGLYRLVPRRCPSLATLGR
jgi:hypothetical protein